jgi:hypothetical protein
MAAKFFPFQETFYDNNMYVKSILKHFCKKIYVVQGINNAFKVEIDINIGSRGKPFAYINEVHMKKNIITSSKMNIRKTCPSYLFFSLN